jgi:hypothetical protein
MTISAAPRPTIVDTVLREHMSGRANHERLLWTVISFERFQREYRLSVTNSAGVFSTKRKYF